MSFGGRGAPNVRGGLVGTKGKGKRRRKRPRLEANVDLEEEMRERAHIYYSRYAIVERATTRRGGKNPVVDPVSLFHTSFISLLFSPCAVVPYGVFIFLLPPVCVATCSFSSLGGCGGWGGSFGGNNIPTGSNGGWDGQLSDCHIIDIGGVYAGGGSQPSDKVESMACDRRRDRSASVFKDIDREL